MMRPKFGTLEWSKKNNGALTPTERLHFLRNMAFRAAREASNAVREKLGLLKPVDLEFSDFDGLQETEFFPNCIRRFSSSQEKLGLLKPVDLEFSDFAPPDTRMAKDAEVFARETHTHDLLSHGYRTYYFGAILASYGRLKYDKELHFAAAVLHDIGLTDSRAVPLKACCFAVSGGRQVQDLLVCKGHPPDKSRIVGDRI